MIGSEEVPYKVCPKCKVRYSTLTRHKCFEPEAQKGRPKFDDPPPGDNADAPGKGEGKAEDRDQESQSKDKGEDKRKGRNDGQGEEQERENGDGEDEGQSEGDGEGEGEGGGEEGEEESEQQAPEPKMPEPETPPVAVVCTVLKFAALTAKCATAFITVSLSEDGLVITGVSGDDYAEATIPWGEFEKRSTIDGEFYVKEVIDGVDEKLGGGQPVEPDETDGEAPEIVAREQEALPLIDRSLPLEFLNGVAAYVWKTANIETLVGIGTGEGTFEEHRVPMPPDRRRLLSEFVEWQAWVDEYGRVIGHEDFGRVVRNS